MKTVNIGLSGSLVNIGTLTVNKDYLFAIDRFGAIPSLLRPCTDREYLAWVSKTFDGFIFCGGGDIDPVYYGEEKSLTAKNICSERDTFESKLFSAVYPTGKPILGICRGMQVINVFLGGSLHQHIEGHMQKEGRNSKTHNVDVISGSFLAEMIGSGSHMVNSFHHQAVKRLAESLYADALSHDRYIEAFHHKEHKFLLGVQWHPEADLGLGSLSNAIFKTFIMKCSQNGDAI